MVKQLDVKEKLICYNVATVCLCVCVWGGGGGGGGWGGHNVLE